ncbi:MAG TPA: phytanoyl-CoA dioxygenase family protein [Candidatus Methylomirabilis sp.]|nr:phytanoyl-CoA dioxygenase family protein [Candidatus Methylomirabilis sp.]
MPMKLSGAHVESYARDGFLSPVAALTRAEAAECGRKLEAFEQALGGPLTSAGTEARYRSRTHVLLAWVHDLVRHPAILDAVQDLIGPDILVYTSTWFIKEPESPAIAAWHQDATYFGLRPYVHVTAWLALTDATAENGCMEFLPGSHHRGQLPHRSGVVAASVNRAGQAVVGDVDDAPAVHAPLHAGEFSLHHTLCLHRSQPNRSTGRRIGIGISYVPTHVRHLGRKHKTPAMLVRGVDTFGHFTLEPAPVADLDETARTAYARSYETYQAAYAEQVALEGR